MNLVIPDTLLTVGHIVGGSIVAYHALCVLNHRLHKKTPRMRIVAWALIATGGMAVAVAPVAPPLLQAGAWTMLLAGITFRSVLDTRRKRR